MKSLFLCIAISVSLFSCTSEQESTIESPDISGSNSTNVANLANPVDQIGLDYFNLLNHYVAENGPAFTQQQFIDQLIFVAEKSRKDHTTNKSMITITTEMVAEILSDPENKLIELINSSNLNAEVKSNLTQFVGELVVRQNEDYDVVYAFIINYEGAVIENSLLINDEKETILKVSSISRYSLYAEARKRDRDWETSVTNKHLKEFDIKATEATIVTLAILLNKL